MTENHENIHPNNLDKEFITGTTASEILKKAIDLGVEFKNGQKIITYKNQEELLQEILEDMPKTGNDLNSVFDEFKTKIMNNSINFSSPKFIAFPDSGNSIASVSGHILEGFLNQNMINSKRTAPAATFVEICVINWLRNLVGYQVIQNPKSILDVGGIGVTGGVSANTAGILLAREHKFNNALSKGLSSDKIAKVFIPEGINHYSIKAAMGWLGLGKDNLVEVSTTADFKIDKNDLIKKISSLKKNEIALALVAYAGDSRTMAIDDFKELSVIAKKENMWFHIDACHGLSLRFSEKLGHLLNGIEEADSITIDPHKVLFTPYACSFLLVKNPQAFECISGVSDLITKENYSFGQITPFFGSRPFDSLKLWFLIKNLGKKRIGELIEYRHNLAKEFEKMIRNNNNFILFNKASLNSVVFIYKGNINLDTLDSNKLKELNQFNKNIHEQLFQSGEYYIHTFLMKDYKNSLNCDLNEPFQVLRVIIGNPLTKISDLKELLNKIEIIGETKPYEKN